MISLLKLCMQIIAREWESRQEPGEGRHHEGERDIRRQILMRLQLHWEDCSSEFEKNVMRHLEMWLIGKNVRNDHTTACLTGTIHKSKLGGRLECGNRSGFKRSKIGVSLHFNMCYLICRKGAYQWQT